MQGTFHSLHAHYTTPHGQLVLCLCHILCELSTHLNLARLLSSHQSSHTGHHPSHRPPPLTPPPPHAAGCAITFHAPPASRTMSAGRRQGRLPRAAPRPPGPLRGDPQRSAPAPPMRAGEIAAHSVPPDAVHVWTRARARSKPGVISGPCPPPPPLPVPPPFNQDEEQS
jgi:hypothetical protein